MSEKLSLTEPSRANPAWLAVPLVVWALVTLTVGLVARQTVREPYASAFFHPFFADTLRMKAWLVTAALVLACGQLLTAARIYDLLGFPPKGGFYHDGRFADYQAVLRHYDATFKLGLSATEMGDLEEFLKSL